MKIVLEGSKEVQAALRSASSDVFAAADAAVMDTASNIEAGVKLSINSGPATGRTYKRRSVIHQASAPGQAPMNDTGTLYGSVYHEREGRLTAVVGSRLAYSAYLEFGTTRMAARPVWVPETEREAPEFRNRLEAAIAGAVK